MSDNVYGRLERLLGADIYRDISRILRSYPGLPGTPAPDEPPWNLGGYTSGTVRDAEDALSKWARLDALTTEAQFEAQRIIQAGFKLTNRGTRAEGVALEEAIEVERLARADQLRNWHKRDE